MLNLVLCGKTSGKVLSSFKMKMPDVQSSFSLTGLHRALDLDPVKHFWDKLAELSTTSKVSSPKISSLISPMFLSSREVPSCRLTLRHLELKIKKSIGVMLKRPHQYDH